MNDKDTPNTDHTLNVDAKGYIHQKMFLADDGFFEIESENVTSRSFVKNVECSCGESFDSLDDAKTHVEFAVAYNNDEVIIVEGMTIRNDGGTSMRAKHHDGRDWVWQHSNVENPTLGPTEEEIQSQSESGNWTVEYPEELIAAV